MKPHTKTTDAPRPLTDSEILDQFIGREQRRAILDSLKGEEKAGMQEIIRELIDRIEHMPTTGQTDGQGMRALAVLHYFRGSADWWITERDREPEQMQAFGAADLTGDSWEMGYVSIEELVNANVELDLYFAPRPLSQCLTRA